MEDEKRGEVVSTQRRERLTQNRQRNRWITNRIRTLTSPSPIGVDDEEHVSFDHESSIESFSLSSSCIDNDSSSSVAGDCEDTAAALVYNTPSIREDHVVWSQLFNISNNAMTSLLHILKKTFEFQRFAK